MRKSFDEVVREQGPPFPGKVYLVDEPGVQFTPPSDPSLASPTLRDLDYLERRVQALETRIEKLENRA